MARRGGWWGSAASPVWPCCCWLCRGTREGQAGAGVLAQPQGTCRVSRGSGMGLSYLSSLLSLEFLQEPVGAGEGLVPTEALLGVAREGTVGVTPEMGQAGAGGRTSGTSTSMQALGSQQESPRGRICSSLGMSQCPWQDQGSQPSLPTPDVGPMVRASPKGIPKASSRCLGTPPPHLSPDALFCREEEEETAEVVEDLESAESLLAGRAPCQRAATGTRQWVQTPVRSPVRGWGPTSPVHIHARHPPLFLAIQR